MIKVVIGDYDFNGKVIGISGDVVSIFVDRKFEDGDYIKFAEMVASHSVGVVDSEPAFLVDVRSVDGGGLIFRFKMMNYIRGDVKWTG